MKPTQIRCPACGAGHDTYNPGIITIVCEYCGNAVYWDEKKIKNAGQQSILPEGFSRLYRGATGKLSKRRFLVTGRVRYSFGKGFWDEWFLEFEDGKIGWLSEDNHEFAFETRTNAPKIPPMSALSPGTRFSVRNIAFVIEEIGEAECLGMEGELPIVAQSGEKYGFADASSPDGRYTLGIEFDEKQPSIFFGKWLKYADLKLDNEGLAW
jgi:hypothetical protein